MRTRLLLGWLLGPLACAGNDAGESSTAAATSTAATTSSASSGEVGSSDSTAGSTANPTTGGGEASADDTSDEPPTTSTSDPGTSSGSTDDSGGDETTSDTGAPACPAESLPAGDHPIEIEHDGVTRTAILHVPPGLDANVPTPLVFNFHGFTMTGAGEAMFSGMNKLADSAGFLVVYPDGIANSWNAGACCGNAMSQKVDDVGYVRALHAHLATRVCYDARRVYSTGMSNGGFLTHRLACEAADIFAAFAAVSAVNGMDPCEPSRPVPVLQFNGTADLIVAYNGLLYQSVAASFAAWAERDECVGAPVPGTQAGAGTCETYDSCAAGVTVTECTIEGMGHCWPGQPMCAYGTPNTDLDANAEMWAFFQQYTLP